MKIGRWLTGIGSLLLFLTGLGHGAKLAQLQGMIAASGMKAPMDGILKGCWLAFSGEMVGLAVIAMFASGIARGGWIVLFCAATMIFNVGLLLHFLGPFIGVYLSAAVGVFFLAGGLLQLKQPA
jgi:hypothetical protein